MKISVAKTCDAHIALMRAGYFIFIVVPWKPVILILIVRCVCFGPVKLSAASDNIVTPVLMVQVKRFSLIYQLLVFVNGPDGLVKNKKKV